MGYNNKGLLEGISEGEEELVELLCTLGVQVPTGFVGKNNRGLVHQSTGYGHSLLLSSGEHIRLVIQPMGKA